MMLPSEAAQKQSELLAQYSPLIQHQVTTLTRKLFVLGFGALFSRMVEGPVVRIFYFKPLGEPKFSSILNKEEEFAGSLAVESVRVERALGEVAISVPRADRQTIQFDACLHKMMTSELTRGMALPLLLGQSTIGEHLYADLAQQPHLLVAGATNSGKSVFTAQLICSLSLFRAPEELEFILVDTKNLDLVLFKGLEHVKYVLNNISDLRAALTVLLEDVRLRNAQMSGLARNIGEWNQLYKDCGYLEETSPEKLRSVQMMKYKILIIDELADVLDQDNAFLAMIERKMRPPSIHSLLKTIAQISRAAGVHLILATQRPSVKVISGDIKANFPARVSFKLPSSMDSRVILDETGAENLLGMGDYLYKIAGSDTVKRAHSAFVSINDIANILAQNENIRRQYANASSEM
jgi:S-DNA-T family DNA segregation ATPase FtsK/SpoIIIE